MHKIPSVKQLCAVLKNAEKCINTDTECSTEISKYRNTTVISLISGTALDSRISNESLGDNFVFLLLPKFH